MVGWATAVDGAIAALVSTWRTALPDATVSDGPAVVDVSISKLLTVGHQANSTDDMAATVQPSQEGWAAGPQREQFEVYCSASAFVGDDDQSLARAAAFDLFKSACDSLLADHTLGGTVLQARPSSWTLHQSATSQGRVVTLNFSIAVDAYTT